MIEPGQVVGIVREISIHFKDVIIIMLDGPLKTGNVSCAQTQLPLSFKDVQPLRIIPLFVLDNISGAIRGIVIDNKYMKYNAEREYLIYNAVNVALFIISGYDHQIFVHRGPKL